MRVILAVFQLEKLGGKERDCLAIGRFLFERGHDVTVVTTSMAKDLSLPFRAVLLRRSGVFNHVRARAFGQAVVEHSGTAKCDVLIAFEKIPGADYYYAADIAIARARDSVLPWLPRHRARLALERGVFENTAQTRVFFLTERQRGAYAAAYGFDAARGTLLPLILHDERFEAAQAKNDRASLRDLLKLPRNAIIGIAVAVAPIQKGVDRTLAMLAERRDLHLVIVGSTDSRVDQQIKKLNLEDRVRMVPYVSNIMQFLHAADFLVHPARLEAAGQVIIESLLAGIPAIVTEICGYASEIEKSGAGVVLPEPYRQGAFLDAISDMIERLPSLQAAAGAASARLMQSRGQWLYAVAQELESREAQNTAREKANEQYLSLGGVRCPDYCGTGPGRASEPPSWHESDLAGIKNVLRVGGIDDWRGCMARVPVALPSLWIPALGLKLGN